MNRFITASNWLLAILATACLLLAGYAIATDKPGEVFPCVADGNLEKIVTSEAMLEDFSCVFKRWEGSETLHFNVAIKNISDTDQRFKVNIFLDNGKGVGGLIPRKVKSGLVKPGEIAKFTYPVSGMNKKPQSLTLVIKTMGK
jgi:hypothetical protein